MIWELISYRTPINLGQQQQAEDDQPLFNFQGKVKDIIDERNMALCGQQSNVMLCHLRGFANHQGKSCGSWKW